MGDKNHLTNDNIGKNNETIDEGGFVVVDHSHNSNSGTQTVNTVPVPPNGAASNDTSSDEALARSLHEQLNAPNLIVAEPSHQQPFNCGACGMTHLIRPYHGMEFICARCGLTNRVLTNQSRVLIVEPYYGYQGYPGLWVCNIQ